MVKPQWTQDRTPLLFESADEASLEPGRMLTKLRGECEEGHSSGEIVAFNSERMEERL